MRDPGGILICLERRKMSIGAAIEADNCKVEAIIGAENLAIAFGGRCNRQSSSAGRKGVNKFTSSYHFVSPSTKQMLGYSRTVATEQHCIALLKDAGIHQRLLHARPTDAGG